MKLRANGIDIEYTVAGEGPWMVLSHSLACDHTMWNPQIAAFSKNYKVVAYDTRGHGKSSAPTGDYTLEQLADDAKGLMDALGIKRCHWAGLSMGGMIGQTFALKYPGMFKTMTLADTTSRYAPEARGLWAGRKKTALEQGMEPLVQGTLERWFTEPYRKAQNPEVARIAGLIRATPPQGYAGCCAALPQIDVTHRLKDIACPTLVIVGEQDAGTPPAMAREIHENKPGSELVVLPNAAHISNVEQAEAFTAAMAAFLRKNG